MLTTLAHLFTPHHTNNHRPRILHPAGLVVMIALFLVVQSGLQLWKYVPALPGGFVLGFASSITPSQTIELTNAERAREGLQPLKLNTKLSQAAAAKAQHMFANNYWAHVAPDGTSPWSFIRGSGYTYTVAGENLARDFNDTPSMVKAWMDSPTHRENIMNGKYSEIGIAVVDGKLEGVETTLVVQMFGTPSFAQARTSERAAASEPAQVQATATPIPTTAPAPAAEVTPVPQPTEVGEAGGEPEQVTPTEEELTVAALEGEEGVELPNYASALGVSLNSQRAKGKPVTLLSPLSLTKAVATSIVMMMLGVLLYDTYVISKKKVPRMVGKNWAHIGLLGIVIVIILAMTQGQIL